jgi:hypothetical protein
LNPLEHAYRLGARVLRPDVYVLMNVADEAKRLVSVEDEIHRLWRSTWNRAQHDQLEQLAAVQPREFLRLPLLG